MAVDVGLETFRWAFSTATYIPWDHYLDYVDDSRIRENHRRLAANNRWRELRMWQRPCFGRLLWEGVRAKQTGSEQLIQTDGHHLSQRCFRVVPVPRLGTLFQWPALMLGIQSKNSELLADIPRKCIPSGRLSATDILTGRSDWRASRRATMERMQRDRDKECRSTNCVECTRLPTEVLNG